MTISVVELSSGFANVGNRVILESEYTPSLQNRPGSAYDKRIVAAISRDTIERLESDGYRFTGNLRRIDNSIEMAFSDGVRNKYVFCDITKEG